jgi:hypothetical protein
MINLTIDASVFALPKDSGNPESDMESYRNFLVNVLRLREMESNPMVTISLMDSIPQTLSDMHCYPNDNITEEAQKYCSDLYNKEGSASWDLLEYYHKLCDKLRYSIKIPPNEERPKGEVHKGTGIHYSLPVIDDETRDVVIDKETGNLNIELKNCKYPKKKCGLKEIPDKFKKYALRISRLNKKWKALSNNFIVIDGDYLQENTSRLIVKFNSKIGTISHESEFNLIGIQKIQDIIDQYADNSYEFNSVSEVIDAAKKAFGNELVFLPDVNNDRIKKELDPDAGPPSKIYYYLRTLSELVKMDKEEAFIPVAREYDYKENDNRYIEAISEMVNAWGCMCSKESYEYVKSDCMERKFKITVIKKKVFTLHLKPCTDHKETSKTVRIYFDMLENKFRIAVVGHHPVACKTDAEKGKKCKIKTCKNHSEYGKENIEKVM